MLTAIFIFFSIKSYIDIQFQQSIEQDQTKLNIISEQISSRLDIFYASRTRALELISNNWPDAHPNMQQWFTHASLDVLYILPGVESIWYIEAEEATRWRVPLVSSKMGDLNKLSLHQFTDNKIYTSKVFQLPNKANAVAIVKPQFLNGKLNGWLVCIIDFEAAFYFMIGDYEQSGLHISVAQSEQILIEAGKLQNGIEIENALRLGSKKFSLSLQSSNTLFDRDLYIVAAGILTLLFVLIVRLLISKSIKESLSQKRLVAATQNSLDGQLMFRTQKGKYYLANANKVAQTMLPICQQNMDILFEDFICAIGIEEESLLAAPEVVAQGSIFNESYQLSPTYNDIAYIKLQIVKAGNDIAVTVRDITPRKQAELALKKREEKYRRLVEGLSGHFLYSLDIKGRFTYVSTSVETILGYTQDNFLKHGADYISTQEIDNVLSACKYNAGKKSSTYVIEVQDNYQQRKLLELTNSCVCENGELVAIEGIAKDITKEKALADEVFYQANHDALTGLKNRYAFDHLLTQTITSVTNSDVKAALCYVDLDQFKIVNDTSGHMAGDQLLNQLGTMISGYISDKHIVARLGGDEFGIIFNGCDIEQAQKLAEQLLKQINDFRFVWDEKLFRVGASIGIAAINSGFSGEEVMKAADVACYVAKDAGRNRVNVYSDDDEDLNYHKSRIDWANRIQQALEHNRFRLFCQSIKSLAPENQHGFSYEILLRMVDVDGELISPALFIPAAERFDLMHQIDVWVFEEAILQLGQSPQLLAMTTKCAINLSGASIVDEAFADYIIAKLKANDIPPEKICFEITETEAVTKLNNANYFISQLRDFGCKFALDDFGAGMCSFSYLKHLPVDYIKIDGSFVKNMCQEPTDKAIVQSINDIAKSQGKQTIAEFVSDIDTENALRRIGVNYVQGYFVEKPMPFADYVKSHRDFSLAS